MRGVLEQFEGFQVEAAVAILERQLEIGLDIIAHSGMCGPHGTELVQGTEFEWVEGEGRFRRRHGFVRSIDAVEDGGLERERARVPRIDCEGPFHLFERDRPIVVAAGQFGEGVATGSAPGRVPGGGLEGVFGFRKPVLSAQGHAEVVIRFGVFRTDVIAARLADGGAEPFLGGGKSAAFAVKNAQGGVGPVIVGFASQGFLVIRIRLECRAVELFDAEAGEVEFLNGGHLGRRSGALHGLRHGRIRARFGRVGNQFAAAVVG